ncbi:putative type I restriction enzyme HindVIIP specificity protein [Haemophilus parahaemolyticus]|uniref:Putative type I restriction enzyme HindVIIP specificity protein n=1 Tax=Haemophilus parahaemolyticus TaxID=735 RepID=A0A377I4C6_HAEPH|nr:restriction endonuclease subunit S [Haemophilus parahaemolyticus]STO64817.1 putative type I restriction enzyme HindVIIP specificity protein [Haemophilus parahaemolyticus]
MSDWKEYTLEELCDFQNGFAFKNSDYVDSSENTNEVFRMGYINRGGGFKEDTTPVFVPQNYPKNLDKFILKLNDITIAMTDMKNSMALLGYCARISHNNRFVLNQRVGRIRVVRNDILDPIYLYYYLNSSRQIDYLRANANSGVQVNLGTDTIKKSILKIPSIEKQREIANILVALDQKIELNTQINQTLEQIAQALFKSWFVDFDPVRAKVQALSDGLSLEQSELAAMQAISGKTPEELTALSQTQPDRYAELAETAKAFPCEMVEVDGVEMPKGWEVKPLPEIIDFLEGPGIRNWQYTEEEDGIKFINIRCIQNGDLTLTTANKITKEEAFGKYKHFQLEEDNIVVSTSGTLGRFAFVRKEHLPLSLNTSVIRFRPIKNKSSLGFIAGFVENQLQHELEIRASGSAQRNFGPTHLKQISLLVPDFKLLELHQKYASSLFEKRKQLLSEIDVLKDTRDLLLPRLLNGEIQL